VVTEYFECLSCSVEVSGLRPRQQHIEGVKIGSGWPGVSMCLGDVLVSRCVYWQFHSLVVHCSKQRKTTIKNIITKEMTAKCVFT